jgi:hypothetical protein
MPRDRAIINGPAAVDSLNGGPRDGAEPAQTGAGTSKPKRGPSAGPPQRILGSGLIT